MINGINDRRRGFAIKLADGTCALWDPDVGVSDVWIVGEQPRQRGDSWVHRPQSMPVKYRPRGESMAMCARNIISGRFE